jgi:hypothetical protein
MPSAAKIAAAIECTSRIEIFFANFSSPCFTIVAAWCRCGTRERKENRCVERSAR